MTKLANNAAIETAKQRRTPTAPVITLIASVSLLVSACAMNTDNLGLPTSLAPMSETGTIETGSVANAATHPLQSPATAASTTTSTKARSKTAGVLDEVARLRALGRRSEALALLEDATKKNTATPEMRVSHGLLALEVGKLEEARRILRAAEKKEPANWRVLSGLGSVYAAEGKQPEAQKAFAKALRLKPDHPSILNN
ncbi:MAG: tetratricopeptide repeat protein, partial [Pseudomonadota bacterium]